LQTCQSTIRTATAMSRGHSSSVPSSEEPFAWAISRDNRTVFGAGTDGQFRLTILGPNQMELCYTHSGLSPTKSIVASCFPVERTAR